ncbi:MAG: type II secretion system protein [Minisyncoccia bacterium]
MRLSNFKTASSAKRGYTLIELIVSVALFSVVMLTATAAYLSFIAYNRRANADSSIMTALSFAADSMARDVRTAVAGTGGILYCDNAGGSSCNSNINGSTGLYFTGVENNCETAYLYTSGKLSKAGGTDGGTGCFGMADIREFIGPNVTPGITLSRVRFYITGQGSASDNRQPFVNIVIKGTTSVPDSSEVIPFSMQTSAAARIPDL